MNKPPRKKLKVRNALQPELFTFDKHGNAHTRVVWKFDEEARQKQLLALQAMRSLHIPMPIATGGLPGKSLKHNVLPHRHSTKFYLTDFKDAYGHVQQGVMEQKAEKSLRKYAQGERHKEARDTIDGYLQDGAFLPGVNGLPQGNITSADLFNWYMYDADNQLGHAMAMRHMGERATRFLDDLTVSSDNPHALGAPFRQTIREIYKNLAPGMEVSHHKSQIHYLDDQHPAVTITGLSLYNDGRIAPSPRLIAAAQAALNDVQAKIDGSEPVDYHDFAVISGYNGVLNLAGEERRNGSRRIRVMGAHAQSLIHLLGDHNQEANDGHVPPTEQWPDDEF